jgi:hypothetical protein
MALSKLCVCRFASLFSIAKQSASIIAYLDFSGPILNGNNGTRDGKIKETFSRINIISNQKKTQNHFVLPVTTIEPVERE